MSKEMKKTKTSKQEVKPTKTKKDKTKVNSKLDKKNQKIATSIKVEEVDPNFKKIEEAAKANAIKPKEVDKTKFSVYDIDKMSDEEFIEKIQLIQAADSKMTTDEFLSRVKDVRHKWEVPIFIFSTFVSLAVYWLIGYLANMAATEDSFRKELMNLLEMDKATVDNLIEYGGYAAIILAISFFYTILKTNSRYLGWSSINSVRLSDSKFEEVYSDYVETCKLLGFNRIPNVYVSKSDFDNNVKGLKIRSKYGISLPYDMVVKASETGDYKEVRYLLAKRISRIYLGHNGTLVLLLTLWARYIPILKNLINRVNTYSIDKMVSLILGRYDFLEHIYDQFISDDGYDEADKEDVVKLQLNCNREEKLGRFFENLVADEPYPIYRIDAVLRDIDGKLF